MQKHTLMIVAAAVLVASIAIGAGSKTFKVPLIKDTTFDETLSATVNLGQYQPVGYFALYAQCSGGEGGVVTVMSQVGVDGSTWHTNMLVVGTSTNDYTYAKSDSSVATNWANAVYLIPAKHARFTFIPNDASTQTLNAWLVIQ